MLYSKNQTKQKTTPKTLVIIITIIIIIIINFNEYNPLVK